MSDRFRKRKGFGKKTFDKSSSATDHSDKKSDSPNHLSKRNPKDDRDSESDSDSEDEKVPLQRRTYDLNLDSRIGKKEMLQPEVSINRQAGFYCDICDRTFKDDMNYLSHLNGKLHLDNLGMSTYLDLESSEMKVSGVKDLLARKRREIKIMKGELEETETAENGKKTKKVKISEEHVGEDEKNDDENESKTQLEHIESLDNKKKKKRTDDDNAFDQDEEVMNLMGFGSFGKK